MQQFFISTPTDLDIREVVTLGLTSKLDGTKIGHKGTGMKFALAYLHRLGGRIEIKNPHFHLQSHDKEIEVKGNSHRFIFIDNLTDGSTIETHLTTQAGADTWTEPWFILRELIQNALDEGGTYGIGDPPEGRTQITIPLLEPLAQAWATRADWLLPRNGEVIRLDTPKGIFYHGFRIYQPTVKWTGSYDVTEILQRNQLSEDRQLRNIDLSQLFSCIVKVANFPEAIYPLFLQEETTQDIYNLMLGVYHLINYNQTAWGGENGFQLAKLERIITQNHEGKIAISNASRDNADEPINYYARAAGYETVIVPHDAFRILSYSSELKKASECLPAIQQRLKPIQRTSMVDKEKLKVALRITKKLRPPNTRIVIVDRILENDRINCIALADINQNRVLLLKDGLNADLPELAKALIEEYAHLKSGAGDFSEGMQRELVSMLYTVLTSRKQRVENL